MTEDTISIGICDDEENDLNQMETVLRENFRELHVSVGFRFRRFLNGEELYGAGQKEAFDLLFLDIEMPGTNGFQLAKQIHVLNPRTGIIFVSAHESFVFDSQEYSPLWFVRKSRVERDSFLALRKYLETRLPEEGFYTAGNHRCRFRDILYIESMGHVLTFKKTNGSLFVQYGSLKATQTVLSGHGFLRTHKSYLVNQRYIEEIGRRDIRLTDGTVLEMGRDRRKALIEAMRRYEGEQDENW